MYRSAWTCSTVLAGAVGVWAAVVEWSQGAFFLFLVLAVTAFCIRLTLNDEPRLNWRRASSAGLVLGAAALATFGLVAWLGMGGLGLIALLAVTSTTALGGLSRRFRVRTSGRPDVAREGLTPGRDRSVADRSDSAFHPPEPAVLSTPSFLEAAWMTQRVESMDDSTLCFGWRTSYVALQHRLPAHLGLRIVQRRQEFLDELERRNPHGFEAWLASGARAAGDPTRYITPGWRRMNRHGQR
jgi:hypothetical protein